MANCFVIMPFRPELGYLYRTIKRHLEQAFPGISVVRGDDEAMTVTVLQKIADCSGRNPNVIYELGMAHALDKQVVLVTADPPEDAPVDIRAYELVSYGRLDPDKFLQRLEQTLQRVIGNPLAAAHDEALQRFNDFRASTGLALVPVDRDSFVTAATQLRAAGQHMPPPGTGRARTEFLIRRLLGLEPQIDVLLPLKGWLDQQPPG